MYKPQAFIFFGPSGSGKGTQARLLIDFLKNRDNHEVLYIETGGRAREFIKGEGFAHKRAGEILSTGGLFPEFLPIWIWSDFLIKEFTGVEHLVCDGLSRRLGEAPVLAGALNFFGFERPKVLVMKVSRDWAKARLLDRARSDDAESSINRRLDWYEENVIPAINYFKERQDFDVIEINGEQSVEEVHEEIKKKISQ